MIVGYARVSTEEQSLEAQTERLKAFGCDRIVEEKVSGKSIDGREGLKAIMKLIGPGDVLVVCKLDRLSRTTIEMLQLIQEISERGARFKSLSEDWADTTTEAGLLVVTVMAGVAQFERARMLSRQRDGIARARAEGKFRGRPAKMPNDEIRTLRANGMGATAIAKHLKIGRASVYRALASA